MSNDSLAKTTLAPLVLRLALAVIFIYHGYDKVQPKNDWGASWTTAMHEHAIHSPQEEATLRKLEGAPDLTSEQIKAAQDHVRRVSAQETPAFPEALGDHTVQLLVAWGELVGGVALLLGLLTR